jgi:hypothetical protein
MEPAKVEETQRESKGMSEVLEMGRVSEETKGTIFHVFENLMEPSTHD